MVSICLFVCVNMCLNAYEMIKFEIIIIESKNLNARKKNEWKKCIENLI